MSAIRRHTSVGRSPFGELLTRLRTERGLTQEGLASLTSEDRISARSITNYERSAAEKREWIVPHRPVLRSLGYAMNLNETERRELAQAWEQTRLQKSAGIQNTDTATFVMQGRESIITNLMSVWEIAARGRSQLVLMGGDSGIGKTTLARYVCNRIAASTPEVMVSWGEAHSWATTVEPYISIRHATDRILIPPPTSFPLPGLYENRPKLPDHLVQRVVDSIPQLSGVLISEGTIRELSYLTHGLSRRALESMLDTRTATESIGRWDEYTRLVTTIAQSWPVVIVLEDMHWAGDLTCSLLQHIAHHLSNRNDVPLMVICTYRTNELLPIDDSTPHPFARFLDSTIGKGAVTHIPLQETLTANHGVPFVRGMLKSMPMSSEDDESEIIDWIFQRTSGQPMLTQELIHHLREKGSLVHVPYSSTWRFDKENIPTDLPTAISTLIAQRLSMVQRRGRFVLEVAAVMGETILPEIMADVLSSDEESLLDLIDSILVERHEILQMGPPLVVGQRTYTTYRFMHAMFQEYIYSELHPSRRRRIHLDIAAALTSRFANNDLTAMGEVAHHYVQAEDWHSAQMSAYRMAQLKASTLDWELATMWFDQAEQLATKAQDPQQLWQTRAARIAVLRGMGECKAAVELGTRVLHHATLHGWQQTLALTYHLMGEAYYDLGQLNQAVNHIELANQIHLPEHSWDLAAAAEAMLSHATYRQGKYDIALDHAQKSLGYSRETGNSWVQSEALLAAANCEVDLGFYRQAIDNYKVAIELAAMIGKLPYQFIPSVNIGLCLTQLGDYEGAFAELTSLLERIRPLGIIRLEASARLYLGYTLEKLGELEAALVAFGESAHIRRQDFQPPTLYDSVAGLLSVSLQLEKPGEVESHLEEIEAHLGKCGWEGVEDPIRLLVTVARAHRYLGHESGYWHRLEQAHGLLMERVSLIQDAAAAKSYLTVVPINVEVQRLCTERSKT